MTREGEALFRAVCENPGDDTPRLVYADWLDENGQPERAEFIRLQCEAWHKCPDYPDETVRRNRASVLLKAHADRWHGELPAIPGVDWSDLFVCGFIDSAWVHPVRSVRAQLAALFAATPLRHLKLIDFGPKNLGVLLAMPEVGRLATLRREGKGAGHSRGVGELVADARLRFPGTEIV